MITSPSSVSSSSSSPSPSSSSSPHPHHPPYPLLYSHLSSSEMGKHNKPRMWLFKTDQSYFESVVAGGSKQGSHVRQYIKPNMGVTKSYQKGDTVVIWYNSVQLISAYYIIDEIKNETETWKAKIIGFEGAYHRLQMLEFGTDVDDVIVVFDLIGTLKKGQADVKHLYSKHQLYALDLDTESCLGLEVAITYKVYKNCVVGHGLRFFRYPFYLDGYNSQLYKAYKQIENSHHLYEIQYAMKESCSLAELQTNQDLVETNNKVKKKKKGKKELVEPVDESTHPKRAQNAKETVDEVVEVGEEILEARLIADDYEEEEVLETGMVPLQVNLVETERSKLNESVEEDHSGLISTEILRDGVPQVQSVSLDDASNNDSLELGASPPETLDAEDAHSQVIVKQEKVKGKRGRKKKEVTTTTTTDTNTTPVVPRKPGRPRKSDTTPSLPKKPSAKPKPGSDNLIHLLDDVDDGPFVQSTPLKSEDSQTSIEYPFSPEHTNSFASAASLSPSLISTPLQTETQTSTDQSDQKKRKFDSNDPESDSAKKAKQARPENIVTLRDGTFAAVRGESRNVWMAKIRGDVHLDTTKKRWKNEEINVLWLIETKEFEGRYILLEREEWMATVPYGSFIKLNVEVNQDAGGLWTVKHGMKELRKLL